MPSVIWADVCRRCRAARVCVPLGLAILGTIIWVYLGSTVSYTTGARLFVPGVVVPAVTGVLFVVAGMNWIRLGTAPSPIHCSKCGYDLRVQETREARCPECGAQRVATTEHRAIVRSLAALPGIVALLGGVFLICVAMLVWTLIKGGVFDE